MRPIFDLLGIFGFVVLVAAGAYWFHFKEEYDLSLKSREEILRDEQALREKIERELSDQMLVSQDTDAIEIGDTILSNDRFLALDGILTNRGAEPVADVALLGTLTDREGRLLAADLSWVRAPLNPGDTADFRIIFQTFSGDLPEGVETRVVALGWKQGPSAAIASPSRTLRGPDDMKDPRLKDKILGY